MVSFSTAQAAKGDWIDKSYNFKNVEKVLVVMPDLVTTEVNEIEQRNIEEAFEQYARNKGFKVITREMFIDYLSYEDIVEMNKIMDDDIDKISFNDIKEAVDSMNEVFVNAEKDKTDIIVFATIFDYKTESTFKRGYTYTRTEYEKITIDSEKYGKTTIERPIEKVETVPAHYLDTIYARVYFTVYDAKSGKKIFLRDDYRYKEPGLWESSTPFNMYKRIVSSFFDDLKGKIGKG